VSRSTRRPLPERDGCIVSGDENFGRVRLGQARSELSSFPQPPVPAMEPRNASVHGHNLVRVRPSRNVRQDVITVMQFHYFDGGAGKVGQSSCHRSDHNIPPSLKFCTKSHDSCAMPHDLIALSRQQTEQVLAKGQQNESIPCPSIKSMEAAL